MESNQKGTFDELEQRIAQLMAESKDCEYTEYLQKMSGRIRQQKYQTDLLEAELSRSYEMYLNRMRLMGKESEEKIASVSKTEEKNQTVSEKESTIFSPAPQKKHNAEFTVGAAVLSVVGGGFILAALVTLGMTFMAGLAKGICLYGVALLFLLVSELLLHRKWPMLGATFTAIGIGGLYLSTVVNYLGLHNFNVWVTLGLTLGITLFVIVLSRKRDSVLYRMIGMVAGYLCFFTIKEGITDTEFLVVAGMILLMNVLCILMPVRKNRIGINIAHMYINTFFAVFFIGRAFWGCKVSELPLLFFAISSIIVLLLLLVMHFLYEKRSSFTVTRKGILAAYYISTAVYTIVVSVLVDNASDFYLNNWYCYGCAIAVATIGLLAFLILAVGKCQGKGHIYSFLNLMIFSIICCVEEEWVIVICLLVLLVISKVVSRKKHLVFKINDAVITTFLCISLVTVEEPMSYALLAGVILSILAIHYWQTYYEILLTAALVIYTAQHLPLVLQLPVIVGLLLVGILIFNNIKMWHGKYILLYNGLALAGQMICFLKLSRPVYQNEYITYLCMLVFGLATIILTLQEKYHMNFKGKYMVLAVFLTYMAFIFRSNIPVTNSILLMVIALVCVGTGFAVDKKAVRIYGLVLSLVVCGKLVLYDFFDAATLQKTILFFVVGVITLMIAAIYIVLEKKNNK